MDTELIENKIRELRGNIEDTYLELYQKIGPGVRIFGNVNLKSYAVASLPVVRTSAGPNSPGTLADDATVGTVAWTNPGNAAASDDVRATAGSLGCASGVVKDSSVKIVKADGTIGTINRASATIWPTTDVVATYGSSSDLWGESWTPADINDVDFGVVISATQQPGDAGLAVSHYLKATNFGFSIPGGAVITGILVEVERNRVSRGGACPSLEKGTLVLTPNGYKKISEFKVGDKILSFNVETNNTEEDEITNVFTHPLRPDSKYYRIVFDICDVYQDVAIQATFGHLFYKNGEWVKAGELKVGDVLKDNTMKDVVVKEITTVDNLTDDDWDLTTKNNHNFFANGILVHNMEADVDHIRMTVYYTNPSSSPVPILPGTITYVSDGRKNGEVAGAGTGVWAFYDGTAWRACDTGATVAA